MGALLTIGIEDQLNFNIQRRLRNIPKEKNDNIQEQIKELELRAFKMDDRWNSEHKTKAIRITNQQQLLVLVYKRQILKRQFQLNVDVMGQESGLFKRTTKAFSGTEIVSGKKLPANY